MRVAFLGSPPFAVPIFEALLDSSHELVLLVTQPDRPRGRGMKLETSPLVELARRRSIPVLQPHTTKTPEFVAALRSVRPDVLLVASYGEILRREVLELAPHGALNVHGSLLPRWRGAAPIQAAILAGDPTSGVSIQRMVAKLDAGDVLLELATPIGPTETSGDLFARLALLGAQATLEALRLVESGSARFTPQDETRVTHAGKLDKAHGRVDWSRSRVEIERMVRGLNPWPLARCSDGKGGELAILKARLAPANTEQAGTGQAGAAQASTGLASAGQAGNVVLRSGSLYVLCGDGALELLEVKPAGKAAMEAIAWWRGARLPEGTSLVLP